jgi:hypothetical protein
MRAFLIDPFTKTVTEIDYNGEFEQAYKFMDCEMIQFAYPIPQHTLMVDEDGLIKPITESFMIVSNGVNYVGKALLLGGKQGNKPVRLPIEVVQALIKFP